MNEAINTLFEASPPLALALAINFLLYSLKKTKQFRDEMLPITAVIFGALVYPWIADIAKVVPVVKSPLVYNMVFGSGIGGLSVAMHQQVKQWLGLRTSDTEINSKPKDPTV